MQTSSDSAESIDSFPKKALAASAIGYAMDGFDLPDNPGAALALRWS
jgi:hypothetical protein